MGRFVSSIIGCSPRPRTVCPEHGVKRASVPWAREGSGFTLLFEQAAMTLVREIPLLAVARFIGIADKRLWRIVEYYVAKALRGLDLFGLTVFALDAEGIAFRPPRRATTTSPYSSMRTVRASR
jgi:hypothetical protein